MRRDSPLDLFHPVVRDWFSSAFPEPIRSQTLGWPAIARGESTLILAPTGNGKTLAAFLWCLNRLLFEPSPASQERCRVLYISPLKALAVDVERNLRMPLAGIAEIARARGIPVNPPRIAIRTGDTPADERRRFLRDAADIVITTPESLFLMLTSAARERLRSVDTIIVDEIHALVPTKRGAHLALSIERLEALRATPRPVVTDARGAHGGAASGFGRPSAVAAGRPNLQRIGLSATQRPLDEVARFLGGAKRCAPRKPQEARRRPPSRAKRASASLAGASGVGGPLAGTPLDEVEAELHGEFGADGDRRAAFRTVTIVDASARKELRLRIEVPIEDVARLPRRSTQTTWPGAVAEAEPFPRPGSTATAIWASIYPRLLELIRQHRSTLLFVNSRRLAERLAGALNELAGEALVRSHHGSLAREQRSEVEELLKAGRIKGLVATSSLELGIDMGAIDLVVQIEAPPSVASGLQRIGRAGHQAGASSEGVIFPKFRGDLVACATVAQAMHAGTIEAIRYPRNPLDVLSQQIVAMVGLDTWRTTDLFDVIRQAAPYVDLSQRMFEGVLDMLSGRYPSDQFAELRPRVTWDRAHGVITGREGAARVAIANAGTIPDRGLYGVFLAGADRPVRVGELDEEMVFESQVGETFTLGASTWRIEEITHDRVLVTPAPGEPGKMPFWHGDREGRPVELGMAIGKLVRDLRRLPKPVAIDRLVRDHDLESPAAETLLTYLDDQAAAGAIPDDRTLVIERCLDEIGDWRVCLLSPLGNRIHAPWAMAATAHIRHCTGLDVEVMWGDEGFVVRFPGIEQPPDPGLLLPQADDIERLVMRQLGATSLFAARFRETAARALLLPRRRPGLRTPLWQQRKRAADLLAVASRFGSFPALLETYRECLRDVFDLPALVDLMRRLRNRRLRVVTIDSRVPSPFAASLLFSYVANYIYDGDAPLAERRAQALSVDEGQLRELLGDAELRDLLNADALVAIERRLQHLDDDRKVRTVDGLHDLLIRIGDLSATEIEVRSSLADTPDAIRALEQTNRVVPLPIAGETRYVAVEDVARYRDALGVSLPPGLPDALLEPVRDPAIDLVLRYARSHGPFTTRELARRFGLGTALAEGLLARAAGTGRLTEGEFRPGGTEREWCDADVLRSLRRRSLAKLRQEVEPVDADAYVRFVLSWHGIGSERRGLDSLLDAIEQLQGATIPASVLEREVLPARVADFRPEMLDTLMTAGEVVWTGVEPLGTRDGRIALYLTDHLSQMRLPSIPQAKGPGEGRCTEIVDYLRRHGASFFSALHDGIGGGFPGDTVDALWDLVWRGLVTNDTLHALRAYTRPDDTRSRRHRISHPRSHVGLRTGSRRIVPPKAEGRWSLLDTTHPSKTAMTEWAAAMANQLLTRHGVVTREAVAAEAIAGGFSAVYQVLKALEASGRIRRGYFVAGLGAAQFARPSAVDLLRSMREPADSPAAVILAATDPANPYGSIIRWPEVPGSTSGPTRIAGALVILVDGAAAAYLRRGEQELLVFGSDDEPRYSGNLREVARLLITLAGARAPGQRGMLISHINGEPAAQHATARLFVEEGFVVTALGLQARPATLATASFSRKAPH